MLVACVGPMGTQTAQPDARQVETIEPAPATGQAVLALLSEARSAARSGHLQTSGSLLERALRIEPRNSVLWYYLAKMRLKQGSFEQAASLAAKSNSLSQGDRRLQADNWRIIAHARQRLGDVEGARKAQARANGLSE